MYKKKQIFVMLALAGLSLSATAQLMLNLPYDEDFSGMNMPSGLVSQAIVGVDVWSVHHPTLSELPQPSYGTGVLRYTGTMGSRSLLKTDLLNLFGAINPYLQFWYSHDMVLSPNGIMQCM